MGAKMPQKKLEEIHDKLINREVVDFSMTIFERLSEKVRSAISMAY